MSEDMVLEKSEDELYQINGDMHQPPEIIPHPRAPGAPLLAHPPRMFRPRGQRYRGRHRGMSRHHPPLMHRGPRYPLLRHPAAQLNGFTPPPPPAPPGIPTNLWEWFHSADQDKDGCITATELQRVLLHGTWAPFDEETCRLMLGTFDSERTGTMNAYQLVNLWNCISDWQDSFQLMDPDKTGSIGTEELLQSLEKFGYHLSRELCNVVVGRFDRNGQGKIGLCHSIQAYIMLKSLTEAFKAQDPNQVGTIDLHYEQFLEMVLHNTLRQHV